MAEWRSASAVSLRSWGQSPSPTSSMRRAMAYNAAIALRLGGGSRRMPYAKLRASDQVISSQRR